VLDGAGGVGGVDGVKGAKPLTTDAIIAKYKSYTQ